MSCYPLLLLLLLQRLTTGNVYTVTPDNDPNTTCHHCHNLQHYLLNTTKYFTSNTQLLFLPGLHHLQTDLIIKNVHNISLIGSTTNGTTADAIIQCEKKLTISIAFIDIVNLTISKLIIQKCTSHFVLQHGISESAAVLIKDCNPLIVYQLHIHKNDPCYPKYALMAVNIMGQLSHMSCYGIIIHYFNHELSTKNYTTTTLSINQYIPYINDYCDTVTLINLNAKQTSAAAS